LSQKNLIEKVSTTKFLSREEALTLLTPWHTEQAQFFRDTYSSDSIFRKRVNSFIEYYREDPFIMIAADASQAEVRMAAALSGEDKLINLYTKVRELEDQGITVDPDADASMRQYDLHYQTASLCYGTPVDQVTKSQRRYAKQTTFAVLYGAGEWKIAFHNNIPLVEAKDILNKFWSSYPKIRDWVNYLIAEGVATGFVTTPTGRRRAVPTLKDKKDVLKAFMNDDNMWAKFSKSLGYGVLKQVMHEIRQARNFPVQSFASDIIINGVWLLLQDCKLHDIDIHLHTIVHDSILCSVRLSRLNEFLRLLKYNMEIKVAEDLKIMCPLKMDVEVGFNYDSTVKLPLIKGDFDINKIKNDIFEEFRHFEASSKIAAMAMTPLYVFDEEYRRPDKLSKKELTAANMTEKSFKQSWYDYQEKWLLTPENLKIEYDRISPLAVDSIIKPMEVYIK
jgi:hypothetical protein